MRDNQLKVDVEPRFLLVTSEPYVVFTGRVFLPAVDVYEKKRRREWLLYIAAQSVGRQLFQLMSENNDKATGLEFWIRKENEKKFAKYILEQ